MGGLYPDYKPIGVKPDWDHASMDVDGSAHVLKRYGVTGPVLEAVAWFGPDDALKVMVAMLPNLRRVTLRIRRSGYQLETVTVPA